jgi:TPR repeat protein
LILSYDTDKSTSLRYWFEAMSMKYSSDQHPLRYWLSLSVLALTGVVYQPFAYANEWNDRLVAWQNEAAKLQKKDLSALETKAKSGDDKALFLLGSAQLNPALEYKNDQISSMFDTLAAKSHPIALRIRCYARITGELGYAKNGALGFADCLAAAKLGLISAMHVVSAEYQSGIVIPKDESQSVAWISKAALANDGLAMHLYAERLRDGRGVNRDEAQAVQWFRKAAATGYSIAMSPLGEMLRDGRGVAKSEIEAAALFRKSAQANYLAGALNLGSMLLIGQGVPKDEVEAAHWFRFAAHSNEPYGMFVFGSLLRDGRGVVKDEVQAFTWLRKSAQANNILAMEAVGILFANGIGTTKDQSQADYWFKKARETKSQGQ